MSPTHNIVNNIDEPPKLTNGSGLPVTGMRLVTAIMFMIACATIMLVRPPARTRPNVSRAPKAILKPA